MAGSREDQAPIDSAAELVGRPELFRGLTVHAGIELGIIDLIGEDVKATGEIASRLDLPYEYARRLLRALAVYGVLESVGKDEYAITSVGERFLSEHPESLREYILYFYNPKRFAAIRHLPTIVADGGPTGYEMEFGKSLFELFEEDPDFSEQFNGMLDLASLGETEQDLTALETVDFSRFATICDIGGGYGELLCRLLERHPHLEGAVLELPNVLAEDDRLWAPKIGVADRCDYVEGDMFEAVPRADAYILNQILHDWSDEECHRILTNVCEAAGNAGQLFIRERIVSEDGSEPTKIDMDMWMMMELGGRERTRAEFATLLGRAGWAIEEVLDVEGDFSFLRCTIA